MTTETKVLQVGDRVKVIAWDGEAGDKTYDGLEGLIVHNRMTRKGLSFLVLLDNDPNPAMGELFGGLPCFAHELEKL